MIDPYRKRLVAFCQLLIAAEETPVFYLADVALAWAQSRQLADGPYWHGYLAEIAQREPALGPLVEAALRTVTDGGQP